MGSSFLRKFCPKNGARKPCCLYLLEERTFQPALSEGPEKTGTRAMASPDSPLSPFTHCPLVLEQPCEERGTCCQPHSEVRRLKSKATWPAQSSSDLLTHPSASFLLFMGLLPSRSCIVGKRVLGKHMCPLGGGVTRGRFLPCLSLLLQPAAHSACLETSVCSCMGDLDYLPSEGRS